MPAQIEEFLRARRAEGYSFELSERGLAPLLGYLRRLGVAPTPQAPCTPLEMLLKDYRRYLEGERELAERSVDCYLDAARLFLCQREQPGGLDLERLTAAEVGAFVVEQCRRRRAAPAKALVVRLRSLLRFLFVAGYVPHQLAWAAPTPAGWAGGSLPQEFDEASVGALLASCDRRTVVGRRDFAILTVLARLFRCIGLSHRTDCLGMTVVRQGRVIET
jgi:site-specific recombinase XerC